MGTKNTTYKCAVLVFAALVATPVLAAEPLKPMNYNGRYSIAWSGITLGRILIRAEETATSYRLSLDTKTRGIGALFSDEKSIITGIGTKNEAGEYIPTSYDSRPQKKGDDDIITLTYDTNGKLLKRIRTQDDDPAWRPPVSTANINTALDPVTSIFALRSKLYEAIAINHHEISSRMYDGMRLAELKLTRDGTAKVEMMDTYKDAANVAVIRTPVDGFTPKELKKFKKGDPEMRLYFTNDAAFLPVRATAKTAIGELSMTLENFE